MKIKRLSYSIAALAACVLCIITTLVEAKKPGNGGGGGGNTLSYQIVFLDDLDGTLTSSTAYDINDQQEIVGYTETAGPEQSYAVYWTVVDEPNDLQTTAHLLPDDGYDATFATGINNHSEIVGRGDVGTLTVGLYWPTPADQPLALPPLPGDDGSDAQKINSDGIICGYSYRVIENPDGSPTTMGTPAVWQAYVANVDADPMPGVSAPVALPAPAGQERAIVYAINDLDTDGVCQIVGGTRSSTVAEIPLRWSVASTPAGLIPAPTVEQLDVEGSAYGINNFGDVSGVGLTNDRWEGTVWSGARKYTLDRARFIGRAYGWDINDSGVVVGDGSYEKRGIFWYFVAGVWATPESDMILLDDFLTNDSPFLSLNSANAVNVGGDIAGGGWTGEFNAYLAIRR